MSNEHVEGEPRTWKQSGSRAALYYVGITIGICFVGAVGFSLGVITTELRTESRAYNKQYHEERTLIEPLLASDPVFKEIKCHQRSNGGVYLTGGVRKQEDLDRLHKQIIRFVGERRASEIMLAVDVFTER